MDRQRLEARLAELPLYACAFFSTEELAFSGRVRYICEHDCPMYNTSWACPPGVGSLEACEARARAYPEGALIATAAEVPDVSNLDETLKTRGFHTEITRRAEAMVRAEDVETFTLSAEACARCGRCAWPDAPCRFPDQMVPCVESHGILVTELAERHGVEFFAGNNVVIWFSLILFREISRA